MERIITSLIIFTYIVLFVILLFLILRYLSKSLRETSENIKRMDKIIKEKNIKKNDMW